MDRLQVAARLDERLRRISARVTGHIARRAGDHYGMYLGGGYPKSGTSWLCQVLSSYLDVPNPQNYSLPIAMRSVLHNHWLYDSSFPPSAYVRRDGRDVMISLYFYQIRSITVARHPRQVSRLHSRFKTLFGPNYNPQDIRSNLPNFIEAEPVHPSAFQKATWSEHLQAWCNPKQENVVMATGESFLTNPSQHFTRVLEFLTNGDVDPNLLRFSLARYTFDRSGRKPGEENRADFMRQDIAGDWTEYFPNSAREGLHHYQGADLIDYGYETDPSWFTSLSP